VGGELLFQTQPGDNREICVDINNSNPRLMTGGRIGQESSFSATLNSNLPTKTPGSIRNGKLLDCSGRHRD
jgi:hypothetical protein